MKALSLIDTQQQYTYCSTSKSSLYVKSEKRKPLVMQVQEQKGLDIVRRDWCPLSKDVGNFALREILSAKPKEEVVAAIHDHLHKVSPATSCSMLPQETRHHISKLVLVIKM